MGNPLLSPPTQTGVTGDPLTTTPSFEIGGTGSCQRVSLAEGLLVMFQTLKKLLIICLVGFVQNREAKEKLFGRKGVEFYPNSVHTEVAMADLVKVTGRKGTDIRE